MYPLWEEGVEEIQQDNHYRVSSWGQIDVETHGTYLGFSSGPGKGDSSWDKPLAKYTKRVDSLPKGSRTQFTAIAYNSLALSTVLYTAQLENPPPKALEAEEVGVRQCMGGPGTWYKTEDAFNLKEWYGQCRSLGSLHIISQAAQLRTLHTHNITRKSNRTLSSVSAIDMHGNLQRLLHDPIDPFRAHRWREWYAGAHVSVLARNESNMARKKLSLRGCLVAIAGGEPEPWSDNVTAEQKKTSRSLLPRKLRNPCPKTERTISGIIWRDGWTPKPLAPDNGYPITSLSRAPPFG